MNSAVLLRLLQLVSPTLPVGAYSYSEGLETLVQTEQIMTLVGLKQWLEQELRYGTIRLEAAALVRLYGAIESHSGEQLQIWNQWVSALRETTELRQQSWQMGRSLAQLWQSLQPEAMSMMQLDEQLDGEPCNFVTAFSIAAFHWQIPLKIAVLGYLQSWAANLVNAGVRLIPLGQTQGQQLLLQLYDQIEQTTDEVIDLPDDRLYGCSWGASIASMNHETLYSRLFRS